MLINEFGKIFSPTLSSNFEIQHEDFLDVAVDADNEEISDFFNFLVAKNKHVAAGQMF